MDRSQGETRGFPSGTPAQGPDSTRLDSENVQGAETFQLTSAHGDGSTAMTTRMDGQTSGAKSDYGYRKTWVDLIQSFHAARQRVWHDALRSFERAVPAVRPYSSGIDDRAARLLTGVEDAQEHFTPVKAAIETLRGSQPEDHPVLCVLNSTLADNLDGQLEDHEDLLTLLVDRVTHGVNETDTGCIQAALGELATKQDQLDSFPEILDQAVLDEAPPGILLGAGWAGVLEKKVGQLFARTVTEDAWSDLRCKITLMDPRRTTQSTHGLPLLVDDEASDFRDLTAEAPSLVFKAFNSDGLPFMLRLADSLRALQRQVIAMQTDAENDLVLVASQLGGWPSSSTGGLSWTLDDGTIDRALAVAARAQRAHQCKMGLSGAIHEIWDIMEYHTAEVCGNAKAELDAVRSRHEDSGVTSLLDERITLDSDAVQSKTWEGWLAAALYRDDREVFESLRADITCDDLVDMIGPIGQVIHADDRWKARILPRSDSPLALGQRYDRTRDFEIGMAVDICRTAASKHAWALSSRYREWQHKVRELDSLPPGLSQQLSGNAYLRHLCEAMETLHTQAQAERSGHGE